QGNRGINRSTIWEQFPVLITLVLFLIPIVLGIVIFIVRIQRLLQRYQRNKHLQKSRELAEYLKTAPEQEIERLLSEKEKEAQTHLSNSELAGELPAKDDKGLLKVLNRTSPHLVAVKKKAIPRPKIDASLSRLITWF